MNWTTLLSTLLGGTLALFGGGLGQRWNERRAIEREARTREHEREIWARDLRREAHVQFLSEFDKRYQNAVDNKIYPSPETDPLEDYLAPLWSHLQSIRLVSNNDTIETAQKAIKELDAYVFHGGQWEQVEYARDIYIGEIRNESNLSPIALMGD